MISDRLQQLVKYKGISPRAFAIKIGTSSQVFGKYLQGREPSFEVIHSILETFDDISSDWLIMGTGDMLRSKASTSQLDECLVETNKNLSETIKNLSETIKNLTSK